MTAEQVFENWEAYLRPVDRADFRAQLHSIAPDFARRVEVEQRLLDAASGKASLPTADECRALAFKLGVPNG